MTRTTIHYDGEEYVVARRSSELKDEIDSILASGTPGWLRVNHGRGQLQVAELLITPGTPIGLIDTSDPESQQHLD
jgi:hypothetical protein